MICPQCGTSYPDGTRFCGKCGATMNATVPQSPNPPYPSGNSAPAPKKVLGLPSKMILPIMVAVAILVMILGHVALMNTSIEDIRIISTLLGASDSMDDIEDMKDDMERFSDQIDDRYDDLEDELTDTLGKKGMKTLDNLIDAIEDCSETLSISNFKRILNGWNALADTKAAETIDMDDLDEVKEIATVLNTATTVMLVIAVLTLLFTIIGGLTRVKGLVITGMVFSTLYCLVMYNWLFILLNIVVHMAMIKVISIVKAQNA